MVPVFKVFSLVLRLFTKPISNYLKNSLKYKHDHHPYTKEQILRLGQFYHRTQIRIQRRISNMSSSDSYVKPLADEKALDAGAEFIGEIIAYGTLIIWGGFELNKLSNESKAKENSYRQVIADIHKDIEGLENNFRCTLIRVDDLISDLQAKRRINCSTNTEAEIISKH